MAETGDKAGLRLRDDRAFPEICVIILLKWMRIQGLGADKHPVFSAWSESRCPMACFPF